VTEVALASRDGIRIVAHELGGTGPPALFVHGTGFNALSFRPLAELLASHFRCAGVDLGAHGHSGRPDSLSWDGFVDDVIASVTGLGIEGAIGIGHSMGATALLSAASRQPSLFSFLYCYEPIVISPEMPDSTPDGLSEIARRRRAVFETREAANERLSSRPPFSTFDPRALAGYLEGGLVEEKDGSVRLACLPEDEAAIYEEAISFELLSALGSVICPVTIAFGADGGVISRAGASLISSRLPTAKIDELSGLDHFGPMVAPSEVARSIIHDFDTADT